MLEFHIEQPAGISVSLVEGWLELSGWAAGTEPIVGITFQLAGSAPVRARYGGNRPDVAAAHPDYLHGTCSAFACHVYAGNRSSDELVVDAEILGRSGERKTARMTFNVTSKIALESGEQFQACPGCGNGPTGAQSQFVHGPYHMHACGSCGLAFVHPLPSKDFLKRYYDETYWHQAIQRPRVDSEHYDSGFIADLIRSHHAAASKVLEVGCGPGMLLSGLRRRGFEVLGQDYSSEAAKIAAEIFGIEVRVAPLSDLTKWPCDAIVLRHVIEHSPNACEDLSYAASMLKPGGLMIVITPNLDSLAARLLASTWEWFIPPAHLFYFSPRSLSQLSNRLGLEVLQMTTRRGDGVSNCASIGAYLDYESLTLQHWQRESLQAALALLDHHTNSDAIIASLGLGNEVIGVLLRPSL